MLPILTRLLTESARMRCPIENQTDSLLAGRYDVGDMEPQVVANYSSPWYMTQSRPKRTNHIA